MGVAGSRADGAAGSHREPPRRWGRPFGTDAAEMADAAIDAAALDEFEAELDAEATAEASAHDIVPFEAESDADEASAVDIVPFEAESDAEASAHDIVPFEAESDADEASAIKPYSEPEPKPLSLKLRAGGAGACTGACSGTHTRATNHSIGRAGTIV